MSSGFPAPGAGIANRDVVDWGWSIQQKRVLLNSFRVEDNWIAIFKGTCPSQNTLVRCNGGQNRRMQLQSGIDAFDQGGTGGDGFVYDHADWADPRLLRAHGILPGSSLAASTAKRRSYFFPKVDDEVQVAIQPMRATPVVARDTASLDSKVRIPSPHGMAAISVGARRRHASGRRCELPRKQRSWTADRSRSQIVRPS